MAVGLQPESFSEKVHKFLQSKSIKCSDPNRLVDYFTNELGAYDFEDLKDLSRDDLKESLTGLKPLQQKKFLRAINEHFSVNSSASNSPSVSAMYDRFGQGAVVDSTIDPSMTISVRYIRCRNLFAKEVKECSVIQLSLNSTSMRDLIDRIRAKEGIQQEYVLELFTHEGYPINVNPYNEDCPLGKWGFRESSLVYVFIRKKKQEILANITQEPQRMDTSQGTHTVQIHSVLYGTFPVVIDVNKDTGESIKQKIYSIKGIHTEHFDLSTKPKGPQGTSEKIDKATNDNIKSMMESTEESDVIEFMLTTRPTYTCRSGVDYNFGKCTYNPMVEQTDQGYAKFYSILYLLRNGLQDLKKSKLLTFLNKEYNLPPLTYALKVLFTEHSLEQFPCWVALIEGSYQLFSAILKEGFQVPEDLVFECSDYLWGMLCQQSEKIELSSCIQWTPVSLLCHLSHIKMVEPVSLPRCDNVFEKQVVLQRIKSQTAVPGCDIKELSEEKIRRVEHVERLLMLSDFHSCDAFVTWEVQAGTKKSIGPLELPTDVTAEYIYKSKEKFKVSEDPSSPQDLAYRNGKMVVIARILKDADLQREIYDPLYDPNLNHGNITILKTDMTSECSDEMDLKNYLKPSVRSTWTSSVLQCFKRGTNAATANSPKIRKEPSEAVVVVLDCSSSMNAPIFDDPTKSGEHLDRLTAAKQLFGAFLNRTEGFNYHHVVGLVSCSKTPKVEVVLTDDYDMFENRIKNLKASRGTALYDSMILGSELLLTIEKEYPGCKRRLFCLTDGEDFHSKNKIDKCFKILREREILVDSVLIIEKGNINQKALSHGTGGFCFNPQSMPDAMKIFETETILSSKVRQLRQEPLLETVASYKDLSKYPYNSTTFYGQEDLRTQYAHELGKGNYGNPARIVQHATLFGQKAQHSSATTQRILQEIQHYLRDPHPHIDIYPQEENIARWKIVLIGPEDTPYEGGTFILYAKFPENYPQKPPEIRFETPIYHCNINSNGRICHSSLDTKYVPRQKVKTLLEYIYGLMMSPEPLDPLDSVLALELRENRSLYEARARELVQKFAVSRSRTDIRKDIVKDDGDAPSHLICPLTGKLFEDPVMTEFGRTYERKALMEHLESNNFMDPLVKKPVSVERIAPNINLKEMVAVYRKTLK